jgi:hypothetical protein
MVHVTNFIGLNSAAKTYKMDQIVSSTATKHEPHQDLRRKSSVTKFQISQRVCRNCNIQPRSNRLSSQDGQQGEFRNLNLLKVSTDVN